MGAYGTNALSVLSASANTQLVLLSFLLLGQIHELLECLVGLEHIFSGLSAHNIPDYAVFAHPDFDPNDYANAILAGEPYPPQPSKAKPAKSTGLAPASEDVSVAISKLTFSLDDVEKQLKNVVSYYMPSGLPQPSWLCRSKTVR